MNKLKKNINYKSTDYTATIKDLSYATLYYYRFYVKDADNNLYQGDILSFVTDNAPVENVEECYKFFEDIATITELKAISQRIQVAKMLKEKRVYIEIAEVTGASTATISRVNKCLNYGQGGYDLVLDRINSADK